MRYLFTSILLLLGSTSIWGQMVPKKILVAHFTNTLCSACASRNPGLFNNIQQQNQNDLIHIAYHPSRPYASCIFNQHNVNGNDDYTKFNGVFGSTPKVVINGDEVPDSQSFMDPMLFDDHKGQQSPILIDIKQRKFGNDSIGAQITVIATENNAIGNQLLYLGLAEKRINYAAPNGESMHFNVFRTALLGNTGMAVDIPGVQGDSLRFSVIVPKRASWDISQIFAYGFIQNAGSQLIFQVDAADPSQQDILSVDKLAKSSFSIAPNPIRDIINISSSEGGIKKYMIYDLQGRITLQGSFDISTQIDVSSVRNGIYLIKVQSGNETLCKRLLKL